MGASHSASRPHLPEPVPNEFATGKCGESKISPIAAMLTKAANRERDGLPVYNFAVGNPPTEPPEEVTTAMTELIKETQSHEVRGLFKYTHPAGVPKLRTQLGRLVGDWQGVSVASDYVVLACGAQAALVNVLMTLCEPGEVVLLQKPFYPDFLTMSTVWKLTPKLVGFTAGWDLDIDDLRAQATAAGPKLRCLVLCSPNNPTGQVMPAATMRKVYALLEELQAANGTNIFLVLDHTYWRMTYEEPVPPSFSDYKNIVMVSSFSKDLSLAGSRLGYVVVNPAMTNGKRLATRISENNGKLGAISPPSLMQHTLARVMDKGELPNNTHLYRDRVQAMHSGLLAAGFASCYKPDGAFYLFPELPVGINDSDFASQLASQGVLVIPGSEFGVPGYLRVAALPTVPEIEAACAIFKSVLQDMACTAGKASPSNTTASISSSDEDDGATSLAEGTLGRVIARSRSVIARSRKGGKAALFAADSSKVGAGLGAAAIAAVCLVLVASTRRR